MTSLRGKHVGNSTATRWLLKLSVDHERRHH